MEGFHRWRHFAIRLPSGDVFDAQGYREWEAIFGKDCIPREVGSATRSSASQLPIRVVFHSEFEHVPSEKPDALVSSLLADVQQEILQSGTLRLHINCAKPICRL